MPAPVLPSAASAPQPVRPGAPAAVPAQPDGTAAGDRSGAARTDPLLWSVLTPAERALAETARELGPLVYGRRGLATQNRTTDGLPAALGGRIDVRV